MSANIRSGSKPANPLHDDSGFTLVEIMVVMVLMGLVMATVYKAMTAQQKVYSVQEQAVEIQDNLRGAMAIMVKDLRLAGCDPLGTAEAGFLMATANTVRITMDVTGGEGDLKDNDGNGLTDSVDDPNEFGDGTITAANEENVRYALFTDATDNNTVCLGRDSGSGFVAIARNVDALEFYYTLADGTQTLTPANLKDVRTVEVSILARNSIEDKTFKNQSISYNLSAPGSVAGPYTDNYRRRILKTVVRCRNMGFKTP